jgi:hypothetical protein
MYACTNKEKKNVEIVALLKSHHKRLAK